MLLILSIYSHETKSLLLAIEKDDIDLFSLRSIPVRSCITAGSSFPDIREGINQCYIKKRLKATVSQAVNRGLKIKNWLINYSKLNYWIEISSFRLCALFKEQLCSYKRALTRSGFPKLLSSIKHKLFCLLSVKIWRKGYVQNTWHLFYWSSPEFAKYWPIANFKNPWSPIVPPPPLFEKRVSEWG